MDGWMDGWTMNGYTDSFTPSAADEGFLVDAFV